MTKSRVATIWCLVALTPTILLWLSLNGFVADPVWAVPTFHVYVVTFASTLALVVAILMRVAAGQLHDPRVLFMSLAFMGMSGIFVTHGLTTPGKLIPDNPWVGFSSPLSLFVCAVLLVLATIAWSPQIRERISNRQRLITVIFASCLVAYGAIAIGTSLAAKHAGSTKLYSYMNMPDMADMPDIPVAAKPEVTTPFDGIFSFLAKPLVSHALSVLTLLLLSLVIMRYFRIYRESRGPLAAGFFFSAIFLAQSQLAMTVTEMWYASWWEYHVLVVAALSSAVFGLVREYGHSHSLQGGVGGLLLRDTIVQLQHGYTEVIVALVDAIEERDPYTRGHTQRVAELSVLIGQDLGLNADQLRTLNQAAMLHDIGKIGIPDSILNKPGRLTDEEFSIIKEHPTRGYRIIQNVRSLHQEVAGVLHHHERIDGSGYPDGLKGNEIPLDARIIAVADVFDALTSARPYRGPWTIDHTFEILDREAGTKLDVDCVAALHRAIPVWARYARLLTSERDAAPARARVDGGDCRAVVTPVASAR